MTEAIPAEFWQGIEQFNQRQFYACHDTLEALWIEATEPEKTFYQGILQIAVALYHLENQNLRGAIILLGEGMNRLRHYQPTFAQIDVAQLLAQSRSLQATLQQTQAQQEQLNEVEHQIAIEAIVAALSNSAADLPKIELVAVVDSQPERSSH